MIKNLPAMRETRVQSLGQEDTLEKGMATHSRILVCLITQLCLTPCDPMDCSPPGSSREILHGNFPGKNTGEGCHALLQGIFLIWGSNPGLLHCRWIVQSPRHQGSPVLLPGEFHGQRILSGYKQSNMSDSHTHTQSNTTERLTHPHTHRFSQIGSQSIFQHFLTKSLKFQGALTNSSEP